MMEQRQALLSIRLNEAQRQAVQTIDGPVLVIAGAGTGKTATLTARVAHMIEQGIDPKSILLLTFTRKAAQEMLDRAAMLFGQRCYQVSGGTFHGVAYKLLLEFGRAVGLSKFTIIDQEDVGEIIRYQMEDLQLTGKSSEMPAAGTARAIFNKITNWRWTLEAVLDHSYREYAACAPQLHELREAVEWYKITHNLVDYDDLLSCAVNLLVEHQEIRQEISDRYLYVMVDEYQDTNAVQAQLVGLMVEAHSNVMAVGDDAQSIYAFRGANYRNIFEFQTQFPGTRLVTLEENFRSVQPILSLSNAVIMQAAESFQKELYARREGGELPQVVYCQDEQSQSQYVVSRIKALQSQGMALSDMAVLFRNSFHAYDLEVELTAARIPFAKFGGLKFLETKHIKDMLAMLRIHVNMKDALAWMRVLTLIDGIGAKTAERLCAKMSEQPDPLRWLAECPLTGRWRDDARKLGQALASVERFGPVQHIESAMTWYLPILRETAEHDQDFARRQQELDQLRSMASAYENTAAFLSDVMLDPPNETRRDHHAEHDDETVNSDRLTLSTIHSAKGLEWKVVFVLWLTEGRFPGLYAYEQPEQLQEELRLLYVATTRAKDELHCCVAAYYDYRAGMTFMQMSSFLRQIPETCYRYSTYQDKSVCGRSVVSVPAFA